MFQCVLDDGAELRLLSEEHAETLLALIKENHAYLREWLPWVDGVTAVDDVRTFIRNALQQFADGRGFHAGIWFKNELVGVIGFHDINWTHKATSIGYWLVEDFQGRGLMTKACRALVEHALTDLGVYRVEIRCATANKKSRAIPERLGFTLEGVARQSEWLSDHFVDQAIYGLLAQEWAATDKK
ncbi:GNAT family N-acetyltransferase [Acidobacteria bacterium AH-259-L09]|nr:GNAT family N-acetyltransferase [Acidobacteria bacterium AH-259-L09]